MDVSFGGNPLEVLLHPNPSDFTGFQHQSCGISEVRAVRAHVEVAQITISVKTRGRRINQPASRETKTSSQRLLGPGNRKAIERNIRHIVAECGNCTSNARDEASLDSPKMPSTGVSSAPTAFGDPMGPLLRLARLEPVGPVEKSPGPPGPA